MFSNLSSVNGGGGVNGGVGGGECGGEIIVKCGVGGVGGGGVSGGIGGGDDGGDINVNCVELCSDVGGSGNTV